MKKEIDRAAALLKKFSGHDARGHQTIEVPDLPRAVAVVGVVDFLGYTAMRDGKTSRYIHEFARMENKPLLCVTPDGKRILLVGGAYTFTSRGIVDKPTKKR